MKLTWDCFSVLTSPVFHSHILWITMGNEKKKNYWNFSSIKFFYCLYEVQKTKGICTIRRSCTWICTVSTIHWMMLCFWRYSLRYHHWASYRQKPSNSKLTLNDRSVKLCSKVNSPELLDYLLDYNFEL